VIGIEQDHYSDEIPAGALIGFVVGEAILLPVGVHLGNARKGTFLADLGVSILGGMAAIGAAVLTNSTAGYVLGTVGQLAITVAVERSAATRHLRARAGRE
jgi:hypothetical protein